MSEQSITRIRDGKTWSWIKTTDEIMPNGLPERGGFQAPAPSAIAQSLMRVQKEVNPMVEEPDDSARDAAEDALDERIRLYREGQAMIEELLGKGEDDGNS